MYTIDSTIVNTRRADACISFVIKVGASDDGTLITKPTSGADKVTMMGQALHSSVVACVVLPD